MAAVRRVLPNFRTIPVIACVLLVTLRLFIGWQFLYEGMWKYSTLSTSRPWTSAGFLKNAQGPFRDFFRGMTGDPDDLHWLDYQAVSSDWDAWANRFTKHYRLNEQQTARLDTMLNGAEDFRAELKTLPKGVEFPVSYAKIVSFDPRAERIIVDGKMHLTAEEKDELLKLVTLPQEQTDDNRADWELGMAYQNAIEQVYKRANTLSFKERLAVALGASDPERVRIVFSNFKGTIGTSAPKRIDQQYRVLLAEYENDLKNAELDFQRDHLATQWQEIQELRSALVGPVKSLDSELKSDAMKILGPLQLALGPPPEAWTSQRTADVLPMVGLIGLGILLIAGLASRFAAIAGALMVLSFYLVWPPFPGVPADTSPEHAYIVNKNLIEVVALLALAAMPTGQWFGVDALIYRGWHRFRSRSDHKPAVAVERKTMKVDPRKTVAQI